MVTLAQARPVLSRSIAGGIDPNDARVLPRLNEASERLFSISDFRGKRARFAFIAYEAVVTLPPHLDTILGVTVGGVPFEVRNQWFEFIESGPGALNPNSYSIQGVLDRGDGFAIFRDICGAHQLKVYCDVPEAAGAKILIQGLDDNFNTVMTQVNGQWVEGEYVALNNATPALSATHFTRVQRIIKPQTNGVVRIFQYTPASGSDPATQYCVGLLRPQDLVPDLRRYLIPGITADRPHKVVALCQRRFQPLVRETDILWPSNIPAFRLMLRAMDLEDANEIGAAQAFEAGAKRLLLNDLKQFIGPNATTPLNIQAPWSKGLPTIR